MLLKLGWESDKTAEKKPIIRVYFAKIKEAFYDLSEEEKSEFMRKDREQMDELGMKLLMTIDCRWSNEEWDFIGVEEWPGIEALEERARFEKEELEAFRYAESKTYLGTGTFGIGEYGKE
ncbi:hypothetical protein FTO70_02200 [Methanosarcina sp. KYL-1]|uniref:hypothetical protein n=1 Tax=Methanosarcina sp. KYL-1 TaxID=2602068 RepID=UPI002101885C|nr:hypothetical protein [Methanosarcina sp. KYL-1]MCQ1534525.1 hypothetical protein [Methanosarcina sp. KYL-1]